MLLKGHRRQLAGTAVMATAALLLSGCLSQGGAATSAADNHDDIVEAAAEEGTITWYTSIPEGIAQETVKAFEAENDITVETIVLTSGLLTARYAEEMKSGSSPADVVTVADPVFFGDAVENDWVDEIDEEAVPSLEAWPDEFVHDDSYALVNVQPIGVSFDTKRATDVDFSNWEFLTDPALKGELYLVNPANVPNWLAHMNLLTEEYGDEILGEIAAQDPKIVDSSVPGTQQIAAGSGTLVYPGLLSVSNPLKDEGATVDTVFPAPTTGVEQYAAVSSKAPNPNAARVFIDYLLTEDAQKIINKGTGSSPLGDLEGTVPLPEGYVSPDIPAALERKDEIMSGLGLG